MNTFCIVSRGMENSQNKFQALIHELEIGRIKSTVTSLTISLVISFRSLPGNTPNSPVSLNFRIMLLLYFFYTCIYQNPFKIHLSCSAAKPNSTACWCDVTNGLKCHSHNGNQNVLNLIFHITILKRPSFRESTVKSRSPINELLSPRHKMVYIDVIVTP